jgi:hypothetical protein
MPIESNLDTLQPEAHNQWIRLAFQVTVGQSLGNILGPNSFGYLWLLRVNGWSKAYTRD